MRTAILVYLALIGSSDASTESSMTESCATCDGKAEKQTAESKTLAQKGMAGNHGYYPPKQHYNHYDDYAVKPKPIYKACASGCTCDGSISITSAYFGIQDVTKKVAELYKDGERHFMASSKRFGKGGYKEDYLYSTLSITYQQFCKYVTVVVPNIELKKLVKHSQHKDYGHGYGYGQNNNKQTGFDSDSSAIAASSCDREVSEAIDALSSTQQEETDGTSRQGQQFFSDSLQEGNDLDIVPNIDTTQPTIEEQQPENLALTVRAILNTINDLVEDRMDSVDYSQQSNSALIAAAQPNVGPFTGISDLQDQLQENARSNCRFVTQADGTEQAVCSLQNEDQSQSNQIANDPEAENELQAGSNHYGWGDYAQTDSNELDQGQCAAQTFAESYNYGGKTQKHYEYCYHMLPSDWDRFTIELPDPITLPGRSQKYKQKYY